MYTVYTLYLCVCACLCYQKCYFGWTCTLPYHVELNQASSQWANVKCEPNSSQLTSPLSLLFNIIWHAYFFSTTVQSEAWSAFSPDKTWQGFYWNANGGALNKPVVFHKRCSYGIGRVVFLIQRGVYKRPPNEQMHSSRSLYTISRKYVVQPRNHSKTMHTAFSDWTCPWSVFTSFKIL